MQELKDSHILLRWTLFITWAVIILWLSLTPSLPEIDAGIFSWDKLHHAVAYGLLTVLAGQAFVRFSPDMKKRWLKAAVTAVIFGGLLEVAQGVFTKTRTAEWGDLLADLVGALVVYLAVIATADRNRPKRV